MGRTIEPKGFLRQCKNEWILRNWMIDEGYFIIKYMSVNIRQFALKAGETARKDLAPDKYLVPVAFIVTVDGIRDFTLDFGDNEQKMLAYSKLVEIAKQDNATAIRWELFDPSFSPVLNETVLNS